MRWRRIALVVALAGLVAVPLALVHRLLYTEAGLQFALAQLARLKTVRIEVSGVRGTLAGPLAIERVVVDHEAVRVEARDVQLEAVVAGLLAGNVHLGHASIGAADVVLKHREERPPSKTYFLPRFLEIVAPDIRLGDAALTLANGQRYHVDSARAAYRMSRWRIALSDVVIDDPAGHVEAAITLKSGLPLGLRAALNGHWQLPDGHAYRFAASLDGDLDRLATTATLAEPVDLSFVGNALELTEAPRLVGTLRATSFDGSPWIDPGRLPVVSGSVALDVSGTSFGLDGTLTSPDFGEEPMRLQAGGTWIESGIDLTALDAWLVQSGLALSAAGSMKFGAAAPVLDLAGTWTALRWPLTGESAVESPSGTYTLAGGLPYGFELQARAHLPVVPLPGRPEADFAAAGVIDRDGIVVERIDGQALGGRVSGAGRVSWTGEQPWNASVETRDIDIAAVRRDLPGRVSFAATIEGRGFTPQAPWTLDLKTLSGKVLGRALTGRGVIAHRDGSYDLRGLRLANGASHVTIDGRYGTVMDLRWDADLRNLVLLHPDLSGQLVSSGRARGRPSRPDVTGRAVARQLKFGEVSAQSLRLDVDADLTDSRESSVHATAETVELGQMRFDSATLDAGGRASEHRIEFAARAAGDDDQRIPAFSARITANGSYDFGPVDWRGRLESASIRLADGDALLVQPAALAIGHAGLTAAPICLDTGAGRFCVEGEARMEPLSWRFVYSAQDWPLERLLRNLLGWREFEGRLQASGWAEQQPGQDWVGGTTIVLEDATLDIPRNKFRSDRVELGGGRIDVYAEPQAIRANVVLNLADRTKLDGAVTVTRLPGTPASGFPVTGLIRSESTALTSLPVLVPEIDHSDGQLEASVAVAGTLGDPRLDGEFHVRNGRFDLYRTNLQLSAVTLDGRLVGDVLTFDGRGKTARGELAIDGRFTWPDNVMTGRMNLRGDRLMLADTPDFRIVASPDLTFETGASGYVVTGNVAIPLARITPRDLSTTVATSPDERVTTLEAEAQGPSTLERVRSRIRVELGDDVRVDSYGLKASLGGAVTVLTKPGDVARGDGSIHVIEGEYKAFGQYVRIVRGILSYDMAPLSEPSLDLVAAREIKNEDIVVSVNVRGTLASPFITLSSEPAMPENEALSYLLTGRSINTLQSGEAASLDRAAQSLALSGGGFLLGSLGTRMGLDEVSVEQSGDEDTSVVLGKYLSPKLFVSYGISIVEAINTIKLRYTLNERWSVKAEAGLDQSADVEFKIER